MGTILPVPTLPTHPNLVTNAEELWRPDGGPQCSPETCMFRIGSAPAARSLTLSCSTCDRHVLVSDDVVELVDPESLDDHKSGELAGNEIAHDEETIRHYLDKEDWSTFTAHFIDKKAARLARLLADDDVDDVVFLGAGMGFEVGPLLRHGFEPKRLGLSDLSRSALEVSKFYLPHAGVDPRTPVALFTSDLDAVPLKDRSQTIVVYECLHHTPDMHESLRRMLAYGYERIYLVEPTNNWVMRALAERGLAQRVEYSGVEPDRFDLKRVSEICRHYAYSARTWTMWEFPDDYFRAIVRRLVKKEGSAALERAMHLAIDAMSVVGRPFRFGNFAVIRLTRA